MCWPCIVCGRAGFSPDKLAVSAAHLFAHHAPARAGVVRPASSVRLHALTVRQAALRLHEMGARRGGKTAGAALLLTSDFAPTRPRAPRPERASGTLALISIPARCHPDASSAYERESPAQSWLAAGGAELVGPRWARWPPAPPARASLARLLLVFPLASPMPSAARCRAQDTGEKTTGGVLVSTRLNCTHTRPAPNRCSSGAEP